MSIMIQSKNIMKCILQFFLKIEKHSRISYLKQVIPQASLALLMACTIDTFKDSLSLNTLSKEICPISDRIVVCANCVIANSGSSTPYEAVIDADANRLGQFLQLIK